PRQRRLDIAVDIDVDGRMDLELGPVLAGPGAAETFLQPGQIFGQRVRHEAERQPPVRKPAKSSTLCTWSCWVLHSKCRSSRLARRRMARDASPASQAAASTATGREVMYCRAEEAGC